MADALTISRMALVLPIGILVVSGHLTAAVMLHLLAIVTDLVDGHVARLTGSASSEGANLDGAADMVLALAGVGWVFYLFPEYRFLLAIYGAVALGLIAVYLTYCRLRAGKIILLHLHSGRISAGAAYLLFPFYALGWEGSWPIHIAGMAVAYFYLESLLYIGRGRRDPGGRTAW